MRITHYPTLDGLPTTWVVEERVHYVGDWKFLLRNIDIPSDGEIKISFDAEDNYLFNAYSDGFFDNFRVQHLSPVVFQENSYEPRGLNLKGIEENDTQTQQNLSENRMQYNGKEKTEGFSRMYNDHGALYAKVSDFFYFAYIRKHFVSF